MQTVSTQKPLHTLPLFGFLAIFALCTWLILRVVLALNIGLGAMQFGEILGAFAKGLWFDVAALAYLVVPWLISSILLPNRWRHLAWVNKARWLVAFLATFGLIFGAVSEFIFWQEFTTRFNFIAVDYRNFPWRCRHRQDCSRGVHGRPHGSRSRCRRLHSVQAQQPCARVGQSRRDGHVACGSLSENRPERRQDPARHRDCR